MKEQLPKWQYCQLHGSDRFPYYKSNDDRWKNSVRHNLSINPHFRKGSKAPQGAGHLWTISSGDSAENILAWEHKKQRLDLFFKMESMNRERIEQHQKQLLEQQKQKQQCTSTNDNCLHEQPCTYDEAATAAATITQEMLHHAESIENCATSVENKNLNNNHMQIVRELPFNDLMCEDELRKSAGQILNGIHREVEVQPVNALISTYHDALLDNDYLNPVQKNVPINGEQSRSVNHIQNYNASSQYYITEIDPIELGIQDETAAVLFNDDFNLNYFSYNPNNDIVA
ncbi:uncharacterized protein LOC119667532 [Teleopsis dalmanni]|uniref:uncharacterized protein LOC119667532 n=1 Tax=Teleopsis dalmanni TaxID=139649 RepID=UPI0018CF4133|nr:uncharacterized protein LOC119667532 [Teleopsis dalmanni]